MRVSENKQVSVLRLLNEFVAQMMLSGSTSEAQFGLGVQKRLLDLLRLGDVHLEEGEAGGAGLLQLSGSIT